MRSDTGLDESFVESENWESDPVSGHQGGEVNRYKLPHDRKARMSLSGSERNHLFIESDDGSYVDVSGNSGLDSSNDGRTISILDYDRDGWQDFLVTSTNGQTLVLYRNQTQKMETENRFVAVRFVGGNRTSQPSGEFTARNGVGARVTVTSGETRILRELHCGEGLAAQNSRTLVIGIGQSDSASLESKWPSGRTQKIDDVVAGSLVTFYEDASRAGNESGIQTDVYRRAADNDSANDAVVDPADATMFPVKHTPVTDGIAVYTAMATWCPSCRKHVPEFADIKAKFGDAIPVYAIPIDIEDDAEKLAAYQSELSPAYELLSPDEERTLRFVEFVKETTGAAELPFSVIVAKDGKVLQVLKSVPTISELKKAAASVAQVP